MFIFLFLKIKICFQLENISKNEIFDPNSINYSSINFQPENIPDFIMENDNILRKNEIFDPNAAKDSSTDKNEESTQIQQKRPQSILDPNNNSHANDKMTILDGNRLGKIFKTTNNDSFGNYLQSKDHRLLAIFDGFSTAMKKDVLDLAGIRV